MNVPIPESEGLPPTGATIYLEWNVLDHEDPQGWYLATLIDHQVDGHTYFVP